MPSQNRSSYGITAPNSRRPFSILFRYENDFFKLIVGIYTISYFYLKSINICVVVYIFYYLPLVFDGGLCQALASTSDAERSSWIDAIRIASYEGIRAELNALRQCIERRRNHKPNIDLQTWRLQRGHVLGRCCR